MREILSLSLPGDMLKNIKRIAKKRGFASVSAYVKELFREDIEYTVSEKELEESIEKGRDDYTEGKTIKANSIADLV